MCKTAARWATAHPEPLPSLEPSEEPDHVRHGASFFQERRPAARCPRPRKNPSFHGEARPSYAVTARTTPLTRANAWNPLAAYESRVVLGVRCESRSKADDPGQGHRLSNRRSEVASPSRPGRSTVCPVGRPTAASRKVTTHSDDSQEQGSQPYVQLVRCARTVYRLRRMLYLTAPVALIFAASIGWHLRQELHPDDHGWSALEHAWWGLIYGIGWAGISLTALAVVISAVYLAAAAIA